MVTQEELKKIFKYDHDAGLFTRISIRCGVKIGSVAGCFVGNKGYVRIKINRKLYLAHRLVWLYVYGSFPDGEIDHINGIRTDNRLCNLRSVTKNENLVNKRKYSNSSSGITGVCWHKQHRKWVSTICINGKRKHLGLFKNIDDAKIARENASKLFGFHVNHGNIISI